MDSTPIFLYVTFCSGLIVLLSFTWRDSLELSEKKSMKIFYSLYFAVAIFWVLLGTTFLINDAVSK